MQAQTKAAERRVVEIVEEVVVARAMALSECQSSAEFHQVGDDQYIEGI